MSLGPDLTIDLALSRYRGRILNFGISFVKTFTNAKIQDTTPIMLRC